MLEDSTDVKNWSFIHETRSTEKPECMFASEMSGHFFLQIEAGMDLIVLFTMLLD